MTVRIKNLGKRRFLHISFNWKNRLKMTELESTFNLALGWVRYAPNCWIVDTTSDASRWYERLSPHLEKDDTMFICELNIDNMQGLLPKWIWEWFDKHKVKQLSDLLKPFSRD